MKTKEHCMTNETWTPRNAATVRNVSPGARRGRMLQLIYWTIGMGLATCGAQGQTVSWLERGDAVGTSWYLPKVAGDEIGNFILVGQETTGFSALDYQTG